MHYGRLRKRVEQADDLERLMLAMAGVKPCDDVLLREMWSSVLHNQVQQRLFFTREMMRGGGSGV